MMHLRTAPEGSSSEISQDVPRGVACAIGKRRRFLGEGNGLEDDQMRDAMGPREGAWGNRAHALAEHDVVGRSRTEHGIESTVGHLAAQHAAVHPVGAVSRGD